MQVADLYWHYDADTIPLYADTRLWHYSVVLLVQVADLYWHLPACARPLPALTTGARRQVIVENRWDRIREI